MTAEGENDRRSPSSEYARALAENERYAGQFDRSSLRAVNAGFGTPVTAATEYWITRLPARP